MKKYLIWIGYSGAAFLFVSLIIYGAGGLFGQFSAPGFMAALVLGAAGLGAFLLKRSYRMPVVLFIFWFILFCVCMGTLPHGVWFDGERVIEALYNPAERRELLRGGFYCAWCLFGMAQVFIKQPPRDKIIIIHSTLSVLIYGIWRLFFRQVL